MPSQTTQELTRGVREAQRKALADRRTDEDSAPHVDVGVYVGEPEASHPTLWDEPLVKKTRLKAKAKIALAWPAAWALYWTGHLVSKPIHWSWPFKSGWPWRYLYPLYNRLMNWSLDVQDWAGDPVRYFPWVSVLTEDETSTRGKPWDR